MKLLIIFILSVANLLAVITITPQKIGKNAGFTGILKGSFETKRGNSDVDNYSAGVRVKYDNNSSYLIWSDFTFSYGKASGEKNTNKTYAHVRLVHTLLDSKALNYETFVQSETNEFTKIEQKNLIGAGLRYHEDLNEYSDFYVGLGGFYENVKYLTDVDPQEKNIRVNSYLSYTKDFTKGTKFSYVLYYQPNTKDLSDYIFSNGLELQVLIYKTLLLNFALYYDIDSKPAVDVQERDFTQKTSFVYIF